MSKLRIPRLIPALLLAMFMPAAATSCGPTEAELAKIKTQGDRYLAQGLDPDGYSKADIEKMSNREQYELFKKRYERTYEVAGDIMTEAAGSDQEWKVVYFGYYPDSGASGKNPLPKGARSEATYTFGPILIAHFDGSINYQTIAENMRAWMVEQDYDTGTIADALSGGLQVNGLTQDGIMTWFQVDKDFISVHAFAGPYWGDSTKLLSLLTIPSDVVEEQYQYVKPYEHLPFPVFRGDNL